MKMLVIAVGFQGAIYKTTNGGGSVTSVEDNSQLPNELSLAQNYPNPFNPKYNNKLFVTKTKQRVA
ncbi:MAG: hypothetical protein U5K00_01160 [Melioribacteraceae bacterium]|nr:hypothetical protein [Melioribacteraceae bacterium]